MDDIAVSRLGDVAIDGAAALVYLGEPTGRGQGPSMGGKMRFYVLKDRGLPRRMEMLDASDKLREFLEENKSKLKLKDQ